MLINFNLEKLDRLLYDFYTITGLTISVWNADFHQISFQPRQMRPFCRTIKSTEKGRLACLFCDQKLCLECSKTEKPAKHVCHAGLIDVAFPIKYKDSILGYIMFGQISQKTEDEMLQIIERLARELCLDGERLTEEYQMLIRYDENLIDAAANILKQATRYLWLSEYIDIVYDADAAKIDEYIRKNLSRNIMVDTLCREIGIPKKRLYVISHQNFGMPIGEYIGSVRIGEAKRLLETTDLSIQQVSYAVGIEDYNYFAKFFKLRVGLSPLKYRKEFPFHLHDNKTSTFGGTLGATKIPKANS